MGRSEWGLRSLSLTFAALSLIAASLFRAHVKPLRMLTTILFLGLSPGFTGHAQEARNYALTLFWATCLTGSSLMLKRRNNAEAPARGPSALGMLYGVAAVALSLSHYFGYLFAGVVLLLDVVWKTFPRKPANTLGTLILMQAWPVFHLVLSAPASSRFDKVKWIKVTPIIGTLQEYLAGIFPALGIQAALLLIATGGAALLIPGFRKACIRAIKKATKQAPDLSDEISFLLLLMASFAALMVAVDLIHPISTSRNYVVALPAMAFLVGDLALLIQAQAPRNWARIGAAMLATALIVLLSHSINEIKEKTRPMMNFKLMAEAIERSKICSEGCRTRTSTKRLSPYFSSSLLLPYRDDPGGEDGQPILGLGENQSTLQRLRKRHPKMSCYEPTQSKKGSVFLLIAADQLNDSSLDGLKPCR